jgi:hypothetical protein
MILIRYLLLCVIGYLLVRAIVSYSHDQRAAADKHNSGSKDKVPPKKISKKIGEYIEYEELKK